MKKRKMIDRGTVSRFQVLERFELDFTQFKRVNSVASKAFFEKCERIHKKFQKKENTK